jgi:Fe-S-cluster containining protein
MPYDVHYTCDRCTACCRWPGQVKVSAAEITRIAAYLGVEEEAFIQRHTRLRAQRDGLALLDQADGSCAFLEGGACAIHAVKPEQCRAFPNRWNFPGWREICQAKPSLRRLDPLDS